MFTSITNIIVAFLRPTSLFILFSLFSDFFAFTFDFEEYKADKKNTRWIRLENGGWDI